MFKSKPNVCNDLPSCSFALDGHTRCDSNDQDFWLANTGLKKFVLNTNYRLVGNKSLHRSPVSFALPYHNNIKWYCVSFDDDMSLYKGRWRFFTSYCNDTSALLMFVSYFLEISHSMTVIYIWRREIFTCSLDN